MNHHLAEIIASILIVGIVLQWVGWRLKIPALILLIIAGFTMGPLTGWLAPSKDFGDLLQPLISLSVAVILFEGGLNLKWHELKKHTHIIYRLVTWNVALTFLFGSITSHYLVRLSWPVALMFGAIIIVTGPTVIMPLLKQANLKKEPSALLRWEGIVNDPIGALLVVLIYGYYVHSNTDFIATGILSGLAISIIVSLALGVGVGMFIAHSFKQGRVPEYLKLPLVLVAVFLVYSLANRAQSEAGLLATTILGITLANQRLDTLHELKRFKEYITILLVSSTFIVLTADIQPEILNKLGWQSWLLLAMVIFVFRPLAIYISTIGTNINKNDRLLMMWIAPRGIVAAAVAGLFGSQLTQKGFEGAELLLPLTFALIIITVTLHGLSIGWVARKLKLASSHPGGVMIIGASQWSTALSAELQSNEIPVVIIDTRWKNLKSARMQNIPTYYGEILAETTEEVLELSHITKLLAMTPNEAYNTLICSHYAPELGHRNVFELGWERNESEVNNTDSEKGEGPSHSIRGDFLFNDHMNYDKFEESYAKGWRFESTPLTEKYKLENLLKNKPQGTLLIAAVDNKENVYFYPWANGQGVNDFKLIISYVPEETG